MADCKSLKRAPGPRGTMLFGCLREFRRDPIGFLMRGTQQYGDVVRLRLGPMVAHFVNHPEYVRLVLEERYQKYDKRTRSTAKMRATCGASLLTEEGPSWIRQRRLIQPSLSRQAIEPYIPIITTATQAMLEQWSMAARKAQPLDIVAEMMRLTLAIASRILFGSDVSGDTETIEQSLAEILADTWRRIESPFDLASISPLFHRSRFVNAVGKIDAIVYRLIENRRQKMGTANDLLESLLTVRDPDTGIGLTDLELRDATITMLLAGHETTANALAWTFSLVFRSPDVEDRLIAESIKVFRDGLPDYAQLQQLEYSGWTFSEAIRLYPSIWIMERRVVADDELGGFTIPAGSTLLISPFVLHRHPRYWRDAEQFDPGRFSEPRMADRPKHAYIPFGAGPHQCIGRFMAPLVARLVLAMVLGKFKLLPVDSRPPALLPGITLRPAAALWMVPVERTETESTP